MILMLLAYVAIGLTLAVTVKYQDSLSQGQGYFMILLGFIATIYCTAVFTKVLNDHE